MSMFRDKRPPELLATATNSQHNYDDAALEGNVLSFNVFVSSV